MSDITTKFAAAHLGPQNRTPYPQFLGGMYFGWVTQRNNWSLKEAIFIHFWWDVIAISDALMRKRRNYETALFLPIYSGSF